MEGSPAAQLLEIIRKYGRNDFDKFEYAMVTAEPPNIRIRVDNMPFDLDVDDLVIARHLLAHERTAKINEGNPVTISFDHSLPVGTRVLVASMKNEQKYAVLAAIKAGEA